ncbi:MAG: hypothetical protein L0332_22220 [Chloroflexi bacterium]|nr:hypothetical protein [Chloroflexota bacterium]MCI0576510.1 hypothetical protein [Chloroflexota bacterium]MCI0650232.1 hypothetical protein [Chloroflexota bacterium]MCI0729410.1 hypothetical protein [Chloroflexota bacterium]
MNEILTILGYISPNGNNIANPVLVTRQIDSLREAIQRLQQLRGTQPNKAYRPELVPVPVPVRWGK